MGDQAAAEERGNSLFREGQAMLKDRQDTAAALACFEKASQAYAAAENDKKRQLMDGMVEKLKASAKPAQAGGKAGPAKPSPKPAGGSPAKKENTPNNTPHSAPSGSSSAKAAPPKKAGGYGLDYSRFDSILDSDDEEEDPKEAPLPPGNFANAAIPDISKYPPQLVQAIAKSQELRVRGASPAEQHAAEMEVSKAMAAAPMEVQISMINALRSSGVDIPDDLAPPSGHTGPGGVPLEDYDGVADATKIEEMQRKMKEQMDELQRGLDAVRAKEEALSRINDPNELMSFLKSSGCTEDEMSKIVQASQTGDQKKYDALLKAALERSIPAQGDDMEKLQEKLKKIDTVTSEISTEASKMSKELHSMGTTGEAQHKNSADQATNQTSALSVPKADKAPPKPAPKAVVPERQGAAAAGRGSVVTDKVGGGGAGGGGAAEEWKAKGNDCFAKGDYGKAVEHFSAAIERAERPNAGYFTNRAASYLRLGEFEKAVRDASDAIQADSKHVKAWFRKGQALEELGKFGEAKKAYGSGLEVMPDSKQLKEGLQSAERKQAEAAAAQTKASTTKQTPPPANSQMATQKPIEAPAAQPSEAAKRSNADSCASAAAGTGQAVAGGAGGAAEGGGMASPEYSLAEGEGKLVVTVVMPLLDNGIGDLTLDVSSDLLKMEAPPHYKLELAMPKKVKGAEAAAKYIKKKNTLKITIPTA